MGLLIVSRVLLVSYIRTRCGDEHNEEEYENVEMAEYVSPQQSPTL